MCWSRKRCIEIKVKKIWNIFQFSQSVLAWLITNFQNLKSAPYSSAGSYIIAMPWWFTILDFFRNIYIADALSSDWQLSSVESLYVKDLVQNWSKIIHNQQTTEHAIKSKNNIPSSSKSIVIMISFITIAPMFRTFKIRLFQKYIRIISCCYCWLFFFF